MVPRSVPFGSIATSPSGKLMNTGRLFDGVAPGP